MSHPKASRRTSWLLGLGPLCDWVGYQEPPLFYSSGPPEGEVTKWVCVTSTIYSSTSKEEISDQNFSLQNLATVTGDYSFQFNRTWHIQSFQNLDSLLKSLVSKKKKKIRVKIVSFLFNFSSHMTHPGRVHFLLPHWLHWREALQCASPPRCNPRTTCRWPGHRAFPAAPLGNGRSDSGYIGISTKENKNNRTHICCKICFFFSLLHSCNYQTSQWHSCIHSSCCW